MRLYEKTDDNADGVLVTLGLARGGDYMVLGPQGAQIDPWWRCRAFAVAILLGAAAALALGFASRFPPSPPPPQPPPLLPWDQPSLSCRFAAQPEWQNGSALWSSSLAQEAYVAAMLLRDGKFATTGHGITAAGLTCDHVNVNANGSPGRRALYTAASKESLHIGMLALVVEEIPLSWHWMDGATSPADAADAAIARLKTIASSYESHVQQCPGCGGFVAWKGVGDLGWKPHHDGDSLPAVDNGQLAWSMVAAQAALEERGEAATAARYSTLVATMARAAPILFRTPDGSVAMTALVHRVNVPVSVQNVAHTGVLCDPFEGELMIMFLDLLCGLDEGARRSLWSSHPCGYGATWFSDRRLPASRSITVQTGWRFSTHELWKYLVLPYLDNPTVHALVLNGERARTWDAALRGRPGLFASAYVRADNAAARPEYEDTMGVQAISKPFSPTPDAKLSVTPYAAFALVLVDRGAGLAWHRAMLARPLMQSTLGSLDSSALDGTGRVATIYSWDSKVTFNLAALGGLGPLLRRHLVQVGRLARFEELVANHHARYATLSGTDNPIAPHPGPSITDDAEGPSDLATSLATGRHFELCPSAV